MENDGFNFANDCEHRILTVPGINPVNARQYKIPIGQKSIIQKKIERMLKDDIIGSSTSLWNSPVLFVSKKSSTDKKKYRLVIDFKNVNKQTETQTFPMPKLDEELNKMNGCKFFSTFDVEAAFHQIKLREIDRENRFHGCKPKISFKTHAIWIERQSDNLAIIFDNGFIGTNDLQRHGIHGRYFNLQQNDRWSYKVLDRNI